MNTLLAVLVFVLLPLCAAAACLSRSLLVSVIVFMAFGLMMSVVWILLESPDLAITEAAVGAGVTSILFFVALKKLHAIDSQKEEKSHEKDE